ncbi:hypothetical protein [Spirosoma sp. 209]|uniref:hypothetical protein n=1 Tax=Spirosoma sp. 209 TaxID=1955701 RepID=UPI00098D5A38|nr:hypothetical protein [Spirosoma sp. 209]
MALIHDLITIVYNGLQKLTVVNLLATLLLAGSLAVGCFVLCDYYSKLWNKSFKKTIVHKILSLCAAIFTFLFVLVFASITFFEEVSKSILSGWKAGISLDSEWQSTTFAKAYQAVKDCCEAIEPFADYTDGRNIPLTSTKAQETFAKTYIEEGIAHFRDHHSFLTLVWSNPRISEAEIQKDVQYFFANIGKTYPPERAITLVANEAKKQLEKQSPKVVVWTRLLLVALFILVQAFPFGLIGIAAYNSLEVKV